MDEDNSFIACDHSSWEFPTGMNQILPFFFFPFFFSTQLKTKFSKYISGAGSFDVYVSPHDPSIKKIKMWAKQNMVKGF